MSSQLRRIARERRRQRTATGSGACIVVPQLCPDCRAHETATHESTHLPSGRDAKNSTLRQILTDIARDAGFVGLIEAIPDDVLEQAFLDLLSCPECTADTETAKDGHSLSMSLPDASGRSV